MFAVHDRVNYGAVGVCTITDIRKERMGGQWGEYYVLSPVFQNNAVIYVPMDNEKLTEKMRPVLSEEEIRRLITEMPSIPEEWIADEAERTATFRSALRSGDRRQLVALIKSVYRRRKELTGAGRHLRASDATLMKEAETLLYGEMALVLNIRPEEVLPMLCAQLEETSEDV
ncbi:MAG: CarD family transcriptional regulator [Clostridia bacterium]|nr:CarD family transcriptional regulator [Clostridia bacterium]